MSEPQVKTRFYTSEVTAQLVADELVHDQVKFRFWTKQVSAKEVEYYFEIEEEDANHWFARAEAGASYWLGEGRGRRHPYNSTDDYKGHPAQ